MLIQLNGREVDLDTLTLQNFRDVVGYNFRMPSAKRRELGFDPAEPTPRKIREKVFASWKAARYSEAKTANDPGRSMSSLPDAKQGL